MVVVRIWPWHPVGQANVTQLAGGSGTCVNAVACVFMICNISPSPLCLYLLLPPPIYQVTVFDMNLCGRGPSRGDMRTPVVT